MKYGFVTTFSSALILGCLLLWFKTRSEFPRGSPSEQSSQHLLPEAGESDDDLDSCSIADNCAGDSRNEKESVDNLCPSSSAYV
ncbi:hypothetical protein IscW_ISCW018413 [Ixodes scapularis]|uniref:Uncharacterized protein n=1 Tax=Ixodes scapularis TaxID=6945 RepID=B7PHV6_IXOSC|nr:hypothetical protein IscW_ISCW018413 [Ixodes scapularis]|eukprot:XP_002403669.1 hypothetical protein IscW_ISCW018413 [Ixodes scapularis]